MAMHVGRPGRRPRPANPWAPPRARAALWRRCPGRAESAGTTRAPAGRLTPGGAPDAGRAQSVDAGGGAAFGLRQPGDFLAEPEPLEMRQMRLAFPRRLKNSAISCWLVIALCWASAVSMRTCRCVRRWS
jgi:hypothetical protein